MIAAGEGAAAGPGLMLCSGGQRFAARRGRDRWRNGGRGRRYRSRQGLAAWSGWKGLPQRGAVAQRRRRRDGVGKGFPPGTAGGVAARSNGAIAVAGGDRSWQRLAARSSVNGWRIGPDRRRSAWKRLYCLSREGGCGWNRERLERLTRRGGRNWIRLQSLALAARREVCAGPSRLPGLPARQAPGAVTRPVDHAARQSDEEA